MSTTDASTEGQDAPSRYEIRLKGHITQAIEDVFCHRVSHHVHCNNLHCRIPLDSRRFALIMLEILSRR